MKNDTPKYNDSGKEAEGRVIILKSFYFESRARLYLARLRELDIPAFLSNTNTATAIPFGNGGISLHIREKDLPQALQVVKALEAIDAGETSVEASFHDAELEDILFEKEVHESQQKPADRNVLIFVAAFIFMFVVASVLYRAGVLFNIFGF